MQMALETGQPMNGGWRDYNPNGRDLEAFRRLQDAATAFCSLDACMSSDETTRHHLVVAQVHALLAAIVELENLGVEKSVIHAAVAEVRRLHAGSPIIARMQNWPRGYAGDYETIEAILSGQCASPRGTLAYHLERYVLDCPASQQHRNKVAAQADLIRSTIAHNPSAAILVVACGSCPDLRLLHNGLKSFQGQLWLNDIDEGALERSVAMVTTSVPQVQSAPGNVVALLRESRSLPKFDLIVAGGLFDYLEDRVARFVIKGAFSCLTPGGRFFFTNIGNNPYRPWMEYCGEWFLRERSGGHLRSLVIQSGIPAEHMRLSTEATGLTHLVELVRSAEHIQEENL
jgi:SAM-dependent methyltransferase